MTEIDFGSFHIRVWYFTKRAVVMKLTLHSPQMAMRPRQGKKQHWSSGIHWWSRKSMVPPLSEYKRGTPKRGTRKRGTTVLVWCFKFTVTYDQSLPWDHLCWDSFLRDYCTHIHSDTSHLRPPSGLQKCGLNSEVVSFIRFICTWKHHWWSYCTSSIVLPPLCWAKETERPL